MANSLPESKIEGYKAQAAAETQARKAPPTSAVIFEYVLFALTCHNIKNFPRRQPTMLAHISLVVQDNLGWEAGKFGDVVCFFAVAYRDASEDIKTQL